MADKCSQICLLTMLFHYVTVGDDDDWVDDDDD